MTYRRCPTCISLAMLGEDISITTRLRGPHHGRRTPFWSNSVICCDTKSFRRWTLMNPAPANSTCNASHSNYTSPTNFTDYSNVYPMLHDEQFSFSFSLSLLLVLISLPLFLLVIFGLELPHLLVSFLISDSLYPSSCSSPFTLRLHSRYSFLSVAQISR